MKHYLMFDLGTGNTRAAIVRSDGEILGIRTITNTYTKDPLYEDAQYFLPTEWEDRMLGCADELIAEHPGITIDAVSSAAARQTVILLDKGGSAFYALPNIDNRGREYMAGIPGKDAIYRISGKWATEDFPAAKLLGLRKKRPEIYREIGGITSESEWLAVLFTGTNICEPTQACEMQLYDLEKKAWSEELCDVYGVDPAFLPPLADAGTAIPVLPAYKTRFHMSDDAVFITGGADTQVGALTVGAGEGDVVVISGTTTPVLAFTADKVCDDAERVWVDAGLRGEGFITEMNPGVTGLNYQRLKDGLLRDLSYEELEDAYAGMTDFKCTASFSSLLFYEKRPLQNGGFFMRSPLQAPPEPADFGFAMVADIACAVWEQLRHLQEISGLHPDHILGCGGGLRSDALCTMIATLSGMEIRCPKGYEQATLLGLVRICNRALGEKAAPDVEGVCGAQGTCGSESIHGAGDGRGAQGIHALENMRIICPREDHLVLRYYPVWLKNRTEANKIL